jgi:hypothetical protein
MITESGRHVLNKFTALGIWFAMLATAPGCSQGPETSYGSSRGQSLNGTSAFAALVRRQGHEVRTARRLTDELSGWADVIIRFAFAPGTPDQLEAEWFERWLDEQRGRSLVYVVHDYDAQVEYWKLVHDQLPGEANEERRKQAEVKKDESGNWWKKLPAKADKPGNAATWFKVGHAHDPPITCKALDGPWARDIDAGAAALTLHEPLAADSEIVLLEGDGQVLAMEWETDNDNRVLAIANGSFLLNLPLVNVARRPLAEEVVAWLGKGRRRVAFVDGPTVLGGNPSPPTLFDLLERIPSFRWAAIHLGLFGLLASLARAPRLGRARPDPPSDADRPAAHAEALGALLERGKDVTSARKLLETYRRWRLPRHTGELASSQSRAMRRGAQRVSGHNR